ncbi:hypothetical protein Cgig2_013431 [Carnegiea gigantea]|uniref:Uncharacterized protein n=1 Tax=Carnegiea gigantea TaxID=171969 RepID=A0A9Q1K7I7_9CARY|nr:hypothetical protein Cgig2_013431 [Carnegiea gigantea]
MPLRSPVLETEDNTPQTKIPGIGSVIVAITTKALGEVRLTLKPLPATSCRRKLKSIIVYTLDEQGMSNVQGSELKYWKTIFPPSDGAENIMDILDCDPSPTEFMGESGDMNFKKMLAYVPLPSEVFCTPFERLHYLKGEFNSLYDLINETGGDATPLRNKVKRLILQACDLKDLQESYTDQMTAELDTESAHYNAFKAKLGQVDSRREELLKEFCEVAASEDLLQEAEWAVIDLTGQIDTLNAIKVIDPTTKASVEKTEAYEVQRKGNLLDSKLKASLIAFCQMISCYPKLHHIHLAFVGSTIMEGLTYDFKEKGFKFNFAYPLASFSMKACIDSLELLQEENVEEDNFKKKKKKKKATPFTAKVPLTSKDCLLKANLLNQEKGFSYLEEKIVVKKSITTEGSSQAYPIALSSEMESMMAGNVLIKTQLQESYKDLRKLQAKNVELKENMEKKQDTNLFYKEKGLCQLLEDLGDLGFDVILVVILIGYYIFCTGIIFKASTDFGFT